MALLSDITGTGATPTFTSAQVPDQSGKVWIVTGGHGGIGLATTKGLVKSGAKVYIASRTESKVQEAIKEVVAECPGSEARLEYLKLDLASLEATKGAAEEFLEREKRLDGVINNAGIMALPYELTKDGIEQQFQVNHLSHWLFTTTLAPLLESTAELNGHPTRVINLSSFAHNFISWYPFASMHFKDLKDVNRSFGPPPAGPWMRYSQAKLSAILFSREFNKKYTNIKSIAVHPGFVASNLYEGKFVFNRLAKTFIPIEEGAWSTLYAATSPEVEEKELWGSYLVPHAKVKKTTAYGSDAKLAQDLWTLCEAIVKEKVGKL
ncbi:short-chain dehydrogenase/reductase SDR family protein [Pseudohyphozyma bogoriensis]|nr:short-chain dehydrogenase/reductase SDR family protein [Pseudohyphozyma bogoriensis]